MLDPRQLYTIDPGVRAGLAGQRPVLVHLLEGYVDAGQVARQLAGHLRDSLEAVVLADFDHDQLHDYRSRRPPMVFDTNTWVSLEDYALQLFSVQDAAGRPFLLLTGPEPDTQWNRACAAILDLAGELGVEQLVSGQGVPMGVPHTRPVLVTSHATDPDLVTDNPVWIDRVTVPGSFAGMLEFRAGQRGLLGRGFVAHVPHYLAPGTYAPAALAVLERLRDATGLDLPPGELATLSLQTLSQLEIEVAGDNELGPLVEQLERQYDELEASGRASVPTPDEIGAAVERFLAQQEDEGRARMQHADELLALLQLDAAGVDHFVGQHPETLMQRTFGGQVMAQALAAVYETVGRERLAHSLKGYFLRPGATDAAIDYFVERTRDGGTFSTRRVRAVQRGKDIFLMTASFKVPEEGLEHTERPTVEPLPPEECPPLAEVLGERSRRAAEMWEREWAAVEARFVPTKPVARGGARMQAWIRSHGDLPDDPRVHQMVLAYASDLTLLGVTTVPHPYTFGQPQLQMATVDHSMWFHRPLRADQWVLYDQSSPNAANGLGFATGRLYDEQGVLGASTSQEGLIRIVES